MAYDKVCKLCGKQFEPKDNRQKYCSKKCADNAQKSYIREYCKHYKRTSGPTVVKCQYCGKEFIKNSKQRKYCSIECSMASQLKKMRDSNKMLRMLGSEPNTNANDGELRCAICGNIINPASRRKLYCSFECAVLAQRMISAKSKIKQKKQKQKEKTELQHRASLPSDLDIVLKKMNDYNKKHGTHLTYGQYVMMVEGR